MSWRETASKGCRSIQGYFSRKTNEENTSLPAQSNRDGSVSSRRTAEEEEEANLLPRKRSRSSVSSNGVPMTMRDCLQPRRNASNAQTSTMSAEPGVLAGDREQIRQCHGGECHDTRPIIPKEPDTANEVFGNLGPFVDRRLRESGCEHGLADFIGTLRRLSREYHDANVEEEEVFSAREASQRYFFSNDENSSSEDLRKLYAIWDHCHRGLSDDMRHSMLGETALSDEDLQTNLPIEVALLALLSCSFDGGLEEMFKVFVAFYSENNSRSLTECVDVLIPHEARHVWRWDTWQEECVPIPDEFADSIFPKNEVQMLQYTSEGLAMSAEKIACAMLHFDWITFSRDVRDWGVLFCSHVLFWDAEKNRHVLTEDFFFNHLDLGYRDKRLYVTTEGRCITNVPSAAFLTPVNSNGMLGVRFGADGSENCYSLWSVTAMAKYNLPVEEFECLLSDGDISIDHLSINHAYNQPSLVQLATREQQAANKRPRDRETFMLETTTDDPLFIPFDLLEQPQKDIALACKETQEEGLAMARLEGGSVPREIYDWFKEAEEEKELWVDLEVSDSEVFFEDLKSIWRTNDDTWLLLDQPLKTTRQNEYRFVSIDGIQCSLHSAISFTKLYHQVIDSGSTVVIEANSLGEVARPTPDDGAGVQVKTLWKDDGRVRRLVTDHIDQNKGNNDPANLRLLCNRSNTATACGTPIQVLVRPCKPQTGVPAILIQEDCLIDAVKPVKDAMQEMEYPQEYQEYADSTFVGWFGGGGSNLPEALQPLIEIIQPISSPEEEEDISAIGVNNNSQHTLWWYGIKSEDCESKQESESLVLGKWSLSSMLVTSFGINTSIGRLYEKMRNVMLMPDEEERQYFVAKEIQRLQSPGHRYKVLDVFTLFQGQPSSNSYNGSLFYVGRGSQLESCQGLLGVAQYLQQDEILTAALQSYIEQGERVTLVYLIGLAKASLQNRNSLLHQLGIQIVRRTPKRRSGFRKSKRLRVLFEGDENHRELTVIDMYHLCKAEVPDISISTVYTWVSNACGTSGICEVFARLGVVEILHPSEDPAATEHSNNDSANRATLHYTVKQSNVNMSKQFQFLDGALRYAYDQLGFKGHFSNISSLKASLLAPDQRLENDSYKDVYVEYTKANRKASYTPLHVIVTASDKRLDLAQSMAKSISYALPLFVMENAEFVDANLLSGTTSVAEICRKLQAGEYACLEFVGYSRQSDGNGSAPHRFSSYLHALGVLDADARIEAMQKRSLYYQNPLRQEGGGGGWCHHVFTKGVLESAVKKAAAPPRVDAFKAFAYLLAARKNHAEECEVSQEVLHNFLLNSLPSPRIQGDEINTAPSTVGVLEVLRHSGWMDLAYTANDGRKGTPRVKLIQDMMSRVGLAQPKRPEKRDGYFTWNNQKSFLLNEAVVFQQQQQGDAVREIPFLYRYIPNLKQYFLLVAIKK